MACGKRDFKALRKTVEVTRSVYSSRLCLLLRFTALEEGFFLGGALVGLDHLHPVETLLQVRAVRCES